MKNKKNIIIGIIAAIILVAAIVALVLSRVSENTPSDSGDTSTLSKLDKFMCVSVTFGENPMTDVNLCFQTLTSVTSAEIEYGPKNDDDISKAVFTMTAIADADDYIMKFPAEGEWTIKEPTLEDTNGFVYRSYIKGLEPGMSYYYRIKGTFEDAKGNKSVVYSNTYTFKTESNDGDDFSFLYVTDSQGFTETNFKVWGDLIRAATQNYPDADFILQMGDAVEDGKNQNQWYMYFGASKDILANNTVVHVGGNRDKQYTFKHYTNGSENDRTALASGYFSFDYKNVHFTLLNTGDGERDISNAQLKWLKKDLAAANEAGKTMIVLIHKAPYSDRNHANDAEVIAISDQVMPLFYEYGVDVVIQGHDHYFYLSEPIGADCEKADAQAQTVTEDGIDFLMIRRNEKSTMYFMNGSAGCKQHDGGVIKELHTIESVLLDNPTFSIAKVTQDKITFETYRLEGKTTKLVNAWGLYLD